MVKDSNGETMSKSKGNVIAPEDMIAAYGADAVRLYILFMAPPDKDLIWNEDGLAGMAKFLNRVWRMVWELSGDETESSWTGGEDGKKNAEIAGTLNREMHRVIGKVSDDVDRFNFNTAIAAVMELVNVCGDYLKTVSPKVRKSDASFKDLDSQIAHTLVLLLSPMVPHWSEELWHEALAEDGSVHLAKWPTYDPEQAKAQMIELAVQVNGKVKARIEVAADAAVDDVRSTALDAVADRIVGLDVKKVVVVPGKLVSVVAK